MKKRYSGIIAIAIAIACSGCSTEILQQTDPDDHTFTISLISDSEHATRAQGEDRYNENSIERTDIFFFDASGNVVYYPTQSQITYLSKKLVLSIPGQEVQQLFNKSLTLYMLANSKLSRDELSGKKQNEIINLVQQNPSSFNPVPFTAQSSLLMDGAIALSGLNETKTDLGSITLKRASAKVIVRITEAKIDGYSATEASVRINNYLDKTTVSGLGEPYIASGSDYKHSLYRTIKLPESGNVYDSEPLYSYANDWSDTPSQESYITLRVKWRKNETAEEKYYHYRIPFNHMPADEEFNYCLKRNHIYTFNVNIGVLGGLDPEEVVELQPYFELKDWTSKDIIVDLNPYNFLVVAEQYIEMYDISQRSVQYISNSPVTITIDSVYYYHYSSTGDINKTLIPQGNTYYPTILPNIQTSTIDISTRVPINYVPKYIRFTVSNESGLTQTVRVVQYPRQYITSQYSNISDINFSNFPNGFWTNNGMGNSTMKNFNFYTITTTSVAKEDKFILGGNLTAPTSNIQTGPIVATKMDAASNQIVSPKFVVATQRGIISARSYFQAQGRCYEYAEGPYPKKTWRMPTTAEMALIAKLQNDNNSAIKDLFVPATDNTGRWWTAQREVVGSGTTYYYYNVRAGQLESQTVYSGGTDPMMPVRCVHDVWEDN